jgi:hypothetical protein
MCFKTKKMSAGVDDVASTIDCRAERWTIVSPWTPPLNVALVCHDRRVGPRPAAPPARAPGDQPAAHHRQLHNHLVAGPCTKSRESLSLATLT